VPFQFNWEQGVGYQDATRVVMNVQPVVPFMLNDDWNLIARWIMPFVSQPRCRPDLSGQPDGQQGHEVRTVPVPDRWRFRLLRRLARDRSGAQDQIDRAHRDVFGITRANGENIGAGIDGRDDAAFIAKNLVGQLRADLARFVDMVELQRRGKHRAAIGGGGQRQHSALLRDDAFGPRGEVDQDADRGVGA